MTRKKVEADEKLIHKITIRVSDPFLKKMEGWLSKSNSNSLGELARLILYKEEIIWYHKDESKETLSVEMTAIRKELNAIGTNINQVTRYFNSTTIPAQKIFEALKVLDEYNKVKSVVEKLTVLINQLNNGRQSD
ncbi:plasmid mobilization relaxosome protein MobC [Chryseolinea soli]|uniref:Plasmid mobilization relaxosome protein MobC n=1 Tax=Chryseolinea soli TaxID=2321403 RepID=A0A385SNT1_9BACT|nr:plasmid mobilization relaxosome protein MobC [Chryseolinea soli]AYB32011.1 plasmid mobilization relaxosome protein MobC [Chryseolinea soli]